MNPTNPITHVVIIVKENHAFDNYFGTFPGANGTTLPAVSDPQQTSPPHDHRSWLNRDTVAVREQYGEADIAAYFAYARLFTLCDNYFTDVGGPSTPNHLMLIAADSPLVNNPHSSDPPELRPPFALPSLPMRLEGAGLTWRNYGGYAFSYITDLVGHPNNVQSAQFQQDAQSGNLPTVSWVYATEGAGSQSLSEHPPASVGAGMQWTVDQVNAVVRGGLWPSTAIFITWDDYGGWYDHVLPPHTENWTDGTWFRYGSRVGCLVLSPYARSGYISSTLHSHVSLVAFCEHTFGLQPLNQRDAATNPMADCFDLSRAPAPPPPPNPAAGTGSSSSSSSSRSQLTISSSSSSSSSISSSSSSSSSSIGIGSSSSSSSSSSPSSSSSVSSSSSSSGALSSSSSSSSVPSSSSSNSSSSTSSSSSSGSSSSSSQSSSSSSVLGSSSSSSATGYAGLDVLDYPGDAGMQWLRQNTNLTWTGFYLAPAPCARNTSWMAHRQTLQDMGWGFAPIYLGQQLPGSTKSNCLSNTLTAEQGQIDARDAARLAAQAGFLAGTNIFLDIERGGRLPPEVLAYYRAWVREIIHNTPYSPGVYCSRERSAEQLREVDERPVFWVHYVPDGALSCADAVNPFPSPPPTGCGLPFAQLWQLLRECPITIDGADVVVDLDTASAPDPSAI